MPLNPKCPRCGGTRAMLTTERKRHGCFWLLLFGAWYMLWSFLRWIIGALLFLLLDWWLAILAAIRGKGYVFQCKRWFSPWRRNFYCPDCGFNFRG